MRAGSIRGRRTLIQSIGLELLKEHYFGKIAFRFTGLQNLQIERIRPGTICRLHIVSVAYDQLEGRILS
jgi:hypothetical protein